MVDVSYYCPYCGAVTSIDRAPTLRDGSVRRYPDPDREYAATTEDIEAADGIEFVCLGDVTVSEDERQSTAVESNPVGPKPVTANSVVGTGRRPDGPVPGKDGCGRTFYLNYYRTPAYDDSRT